MGYHGFKNLVWVRLVPKLACVDQSLKFGVGLKVYVGQHQYFCH